MNICIVTVYNTENCGSFWQAYSLADVITKMGHNVSFLYRDLKGTVQSLRGHLHVFSVKCAKLDFLSAYYVWKKAKTFKNAVKQFNIIYEGSEEFKNIDMFVLGSDTIWNFSASRFMNNYDLYTGGRFLPKPSITYAASAANTPIAVFRSNKNIKTYIEKLKAISVRDIDTWNIVSELISSEATKVCDPTMLTERNLFDKCAKNIDAQNYILLYHFASISDSVKKEILKLKKRHGFKVISFGEHRSWCDKTICYDPYDFISYFKNASFVVTDTFHGTIFSILYEKNFAEYGKNKKKITDLLHSLELTSRIKTDNVSLCEMFDNRPDYNRVNELVRVLREESVSYLKTNLSVDEIIER